MYSNGKLLPLVSVSEIVSCETGPHESLLYCKTWNVSVLPLPHFSFSTGTDLSNVDWLPLCRLSEELTSARCTPISRWTASLCGLSAVYSLSASNISRENPRSFGSLLFNIMGKFRRFTVDSCKRPVGECKVRSAFKS